MSETDKLRLPPSVRKLPRRELHERIRALIEFAELKGPGGADQTGGGPALATFKAQYLTQELIRRDQDRQTRRIIRMTITMTAMTLVITVMTLVIMAATIWPQGLHALGSHASAWCG